MGPLSRAIIKLRIDISTAVFIRLEAAAYKDFFHHFVRLTIEGGLHFFL